MSRESLGLWPPASGLQSPVLPSLQPPASSLRYNTSVQKAIGIGMLPPLLWLLAVLPAAPASREVAITIDDLPVAQSGDNACEFDRLRSLTQRLLAPLRERRVPVTAFMVGSKCGNLTPQQRTEILRLWIGAGAELGNHTWSHKGLNDTPITDYEKDILRNEAVLRQAMGKRRLRYFRSPMLQTGVDRPTKARLESFLAGHGYRQAPVTFDNSDWMFAYVHHGARARGDTELARRTGQAYVPYLESVIAFFEQRSVEVVGREFPQVMLLHANELNSEMLPAILDMFQRRGYRFVTLERALRDPAYRLPNDYAGRGGFSWIHRWSQTKGMPNKGEPDEPGWIREAYERLSKR